MTTTNRPPFDAQKDARTANELAAWAELLELCEDDCQVFQTTAAMRSAIIKVEKQLDRLHAIEATAHQLATMITGE